MKFLGIYLAANRARHPNYPLVYQDIDSKYGCDLGGDMLETDLSSYDFVIATPPCNGWSKANPYWYYSDYSWRTIHLLPLILKKLAECGKPFIVENVINRKRFESHGIYRLCNKFGILVYECGRHTYFTNRFFLLSCEQHIDFVYGGKRVNSDGYNQGGSNVYGVIEIWLEQLFSSLPKGV